jgi:hypothetical protein
MTSSLYVNRRPLRVTLEETATVSFITGISPPGDILSSVSGFPTSKRSWRASQREEFRQANTDKRRGLSDTTRTGSAGYTERSEL